ncbi:tripartite tricarboxylate transporter substrate-binding protein [Variovorax sp. J22R115]|uniref:tripartite tricarboxylate transporter substrate-binding protein n=1 Tax=Variovorax sp. J22R115 TaxID=3053509 RepID=UPI002576785C|nr:tripartite tricarboxylate transporter substrate-binding protein [Variovorax sp. J22R115]MDM0047894.1 tripartite tricarboxylate transporter substrate-binding protein [Variovorax sp. J22R115]
MRQTASERDDCDTLVAALALIRAGRLRALLVMAPERLTALPVVPTPAEAGMPQFALSAGGLVAPVGTARATVALLSDAVMRALASPEVRAQLASQQLEPMPLPSAAFGALILSDLPFRSDFVRHSRVRLEFCKALAERWSLRGLTDR